MNEPFSRMQDPASRAKRYRKVAAQYSELANNASSAFLRTHYRRLAEEYRMRAEGEWRVLEREGALIAERIET
ncbi:MAG TPA: hypothetical protein VGP86_08970 [Xanthobacteraceae bacterium]|jgi:hypothetical protein|nr:hypothetical protein [Xanthobacteraceae bacterium]